VTGNSADSDGGGGFFVRSSSQVTLTDCIVWGNSAREIGGSGQASVGYSDVRGGWPGEGNIDADPLFASYRDFDYLLRPGSPCIDAGDPAVEDGITWPRRYHNGTRSDMGAYGGPCNGMWLGLPCAEQ
jgi:hypothetical protein